MDKGFQKKDYGKITFGRFEGMRWDKLRKDYLEYLISDDCNTLPERKEIARLELEQRRVCENQLELIPHVLKKK